MTYKNMQQRLFLISVMICTNFTFSTVNSGISYSALFWCFALPNVTTDPSFNTKMLEMINNMYKTLTKYCCYLVNYENNEN